MEVIESSLRPGDVILVYSNSWISKVIRFGLDIFRRRLGDAGRQIYSHCATVIDIFGVKMVGEALFPKYCIDSYENTYKDKGRKMIVLTPVVPYSQEEIRDLSIESMKLTREKLYYGFADTILYQPMLILTGRWYGSTGSRANRSVNCSEAAAYLANHARPGMCSDQHMYNPYMFMMNPNYRILGSDESGWENELKSYYARTEGVRRRD